MAVGDRIPVGGGGTSGPTEIKVWGGITSGGWAVSSGSMVFDNDTMQIDPTLTLSSTPFDQENYSAATTPTSGTSYLDVIYTPGTTGVLYQFYVYLSFVQTCTGDPESPT